MATLLTVPGQHSTTWVNPTSETMSVDIFDASPPAADRDKGEYDFQRSKTAAHWYRVAFPPGEEITLPSKYDRAIHLVDAQGVVMGGLAPQLKRVGSKNRLHPALDPETEKRAEEEKHKVVVQKQMEAAGALLMAAKDAITAPSPAPAQSQAKK